MTPAQYQALQAAYAARDATEARARSAEAAEPPEWRDEAIDTQARAESRAGFIGGWKPCHTGDAA